MTHSVLQIAARAPRLAERPVRYRIGLIILATDHTPETDFRKMISSDQIGIYTTRIPYANPTTPANLRAMRPALTEAAALILPNEDLDVVVFSCTSASVVIGNDEVERAIKKAKPSATVVTPTIAAVRALRAINARTISILTPYTPETSEPLIPYFSDQGITVDRLTCLNLTDDREMARIEPDDLIAYAQDAATAASDALFICCTALRSAAVASKIEAIIKKPVITSNLATGWMCLGLCGERPGSYGDSLVFSLAPPAH